MADGFDLHIFTEPWDEMQAEIKTASDRATMYALRATGRAVRAAARGAAPVYKGSDKRATAESGNLRNSIKASRSLTRIGDGTYQLTVMPVGSVKQGTAVSRYGNKAARASTLARRSAQGSGRSSSGEVRGVPLYRRQMEEKYGYMKAGINVGLADARAVYEEAYAKAFAKYAP